MNEPSKYILFSSHFANLHTPFTLDAAGQKAIGLSSLNEDLVPPYFIVTSSLFKEWRINKHVAVQILQETLRFGLEVLDKSKNSRFIARSSAKIESFDERGYYESSAGGIVSGSLLQCILQIWEKNLESIQKYPNNEFAVIVQEYIKPKFSGHLSNERRISRNKNEWLIEIVNEKGDFVESVKFLSKKNNQLPNAYIYLPDKKRIN